MFRYFFRIIGIIWGSLIITIGLSLFIAPMLSSQGTILITNDLLLGNDERFHLYDISRQQSYRFSPDMSDEALFVSLSPHGRRMAILNVNLNQFSLAIMNFRGQTLIERIPANDVLDFDEAQWSSDGRYFMYYDTANRGGASIFILDIDSQERLELPTGNTLEPSATWTLDRMRLAYTDSSEDETGSQILIADSNGDNQISVTNNENASYCPVWSPDGEYIAYLEAVSDGERLRYIAVNNTDEPDFHSGIWHMTSCPLWSTNGESILFVNLDESTRQTTVLMLNIQSGEIQEILPVNQTVSLQVWR